jgi:hypothetical protein
MRSTLLALATTLVILSGTARADEASEAKLQFELGQELYNQKRLAEAIERFVASNRLVPNANVVFNIASTYNLLANAELKKHDSAKADDHAIEAYNWIEAYLALDLRDQERNDGLKLRDSLVSRVAIVDVTSEPAGAEIVVDREALGAVARSPRRVAIPLGEHTIILKKSGYREGQTSVTARKGTQVAISVQLERMTGLLHVDSEPRGAEVRLEPGNEALGKTPLDRTLPLGPARVVLALPGYVEVTRDVAINEGCTTTFAVTFQRAAQSVATLSVTGSPTTASVRLAGRPLGQVPMSVGGLLPGHGLLEIGAPNHQTWIGDVPFEAGGATRIAVRLAPEPRHVWRGWKWVGYAVGAGALAGGLTVGAVARSSHDDFFANPTASEYQRVNTLNVTADVLLSVGTVALLTTAAFSWFWPPPAKSRVDVSIVR